MAQGKPGDASPVDVLEIGELSLPPGEYVVIDEQGHEAFIPHRGYEKYDAHRSSGNCPPSIRD